MTAARYRLAAVTSHPVQYQSPLFQRLAADPRIDLTVFYGHDGSLAGDLDDGFGRAVTWDRPLLDDHRHVVLQRRADRLNAPRRLAADSRLIRHLRRGRFDAVFVHSYATRISLLAYAGAVASRTPVLLRTESETFRPRPLAVEAIKRVSLKLLFAITAGVLVIGKANRSFYDNYGVPPSRQFFTPYSVDNAYFQQQRRLLEPSRRCLRQQYGWTDDTVVIGFSGKLIPRKRPEDLVEAVAILQREGRQVGLLLVGEGPLRSALEERVRAVDLSAAVFAGFRNQSELARFYGCMDVFVLPSEYDTWGLVLNEAMLFGVPVVASSMVGAAADLIQDGCNGFVYPVADVPALAGALRRLVDSPEGRRTMGGHSEQIVRRYSYEACVDGIIHALRRVSRKSDIAGV